MRTRRLISAAALLVPALLLAPFPGSGDARSAASGEGASPAEILERFGPALVTVRYVLEQEGNEFGGFTQRTHLSGGGLFVRPDGLVALGGEIFPDEDEQLNRLLRLVDFEVVRREGEVLPAALAGWDEEANVAFVKTRSDGPFPHVGFDGEADPEVGETLLALGRLAEGFGGLPLVKPVYVAARTEAGRMVLGEILDVRFLGGPLVARDGRAVGIVGIDPLAPGVDPQRQPEYFPTFVATVPQGKRFGLPVGIPASAFLDSVASPPPVPAPGQREKAWIGITLQNVPRELARHWDLPSESGVAVTSVLEGSPAEKAGLRVGDVILSFAGEPVRAEKETDLDRFIKMVQRAGVDREVELEMFRRGRVRKVTLSLANAPMPMRTAPSYTSTDFGLKVRELTFDFLQRNNLPRDLRGVVVEELEGGGWARVGGLREGDVIRAVHRWEIRNVEDLREALAAIREERSREVVFFVQRGANTVFVSIRTDY